MHYLTMLMSLFLILISRIELERLFFVADEKGCQAKSWYYDTFRPCLTWRDPDVWPALRNAVSCAEDAIRCSCGCRCSTAEAGEQREANKAAEKGPCWGGRWLAYNSQTHGRQEPGTSLGTTQVLPRHHTRTFHQEAPGAHVCAVCFSHSVL